MKTIYLTFLALLSFSVLADEKWQVLLDKDLSHWDTYISFKHQKHYDGSIPTDSRGNVIQPIGLNTGNAELGIFTTMQQGKELLLKVSGEYYGAVTTKQEYQNYHLKLMFRWGNRKWVPRLNKLKDSGILYHAIGEHGQEHFRSWMISQEFQIMQGHIGDYWNQVTTAIDVRAFLPEYIMNPIADETQPFLPVGNGENTKGFVLRKENHELAHGKWNTLELITYNGKSLHIVNGHVVMILQKSRNVINGSATALNKGKIQLQSEAAEIFYKNILIKPITQLEDKYAVLFSKKQIQ